MVASKTKRDLMSDISVLVVTHNSEHYVDACVQSLRVALGGMDSEIVVYDNASDDHVDDHQVQIARELAGRALAVYRNVDQLAWVDIEESARWRALRQSTE